jgi:Ca2+/Na+ antiporter
MKVYDYIIVLKRPDYTLVDLISRLMLMLSVAMFSYTIFLVHQFSWFIVLLTALIAGIIVWMIYSYKKQKRTEIVFYRFGLLLAMIGWAALSGASIITIFYFLAVISEKQVKFPKEIAFDDAGVVINSLPKKSYPWGFLSNVVLKDRILTIDFKNNKLIQKETESDTTAVEEKEFNEFCMARLHAQSAMLKA